MAPSRGFQFAWRASKKYQQPRCYTNLAQAATNSTRQCQIYISRSLDPYINLSIEHYLLQKTPPDSKVLFLYTNKPCVVIGRNQNPWVEVNLALLKQQQQQQQQQQQYQQQQQHPSAPSPSSSSPSPPLSSSSALLSPTTTTGDVILVRRRSGGGTVFHDTGNVNYSVICPTADFDRDRHAEMVVRALGALGVAGAAVNARHDIVLAPSAAASAVAPVVARKVSGSAYKLTRLRALHHGTCLLSSPGVGAIARLLRAPARPYVRARGVDSVSSPVANAGVRDNADFEAAVVREFVQMYGGGGVVGAGGEGGRGRGGGREAPEVLVVGERDAVEVPEIVGGLKEIMSDDWTFLQTPQFTFSTHKTEDDTRDRPPLPEFLPKDLNIAFTARNGAIVDANISFAGAEANAPIGASLIGKRIHEIQNWSDVFHGSSGYPLNKVSLWLNTLFGQGPR